MSRRGGESEAARGYGVTHKRLRAHWAPIVRAGLATCVYCGESITGKFELDHADDRRSWNGVAHPKCNAREGGLKSQRLTNGRARIVTSQEW
jgi:hypothetical protein